MHQQWYDSYHDMKGKGKGRPDVKVRRVHSQQNIIKRMKGEVLKGCEIVFSGLIPVNQEPETYVQSLTAARRFGRWPRSLVPSATGT